MGKFILHKRRLTAAMGLILSTTLMTGCASQELDSIVQRFLDQENFNLAGESERSLNSANMLFREFDAQYRPN